MELLEVFPLKITGPSTLLCYVGLPGAGEPSRLLFRFLQLHGVKIICLLEGVAEPGKRNLLLALEEKDAHAFMEELQALRDVMQAEALIVRESLAVIRILGPHFDIRPGIAGILFRKLSRQGIRVFANSTTITSSLLIVADAQVEPATRVLKSVFRFPKS